MDPTLAKLDPAWRIRCEVTLTRPNVVRQTPNLGQIRMQACFCENRANFGRHRPTLAYIGSIVAEIGRNRPNSGQLCLLDSSVSALPFRARRFFAVGGCALLLVAAAQHFFLVYFCEGLSTSHISKLQILVGGLRVRTAGGPTPPPPSTAQIPAGSSSAPPLAARPSPREESRVSRTTGATSCTAGASGPPRPLQVHLPAKLAETLDG